MESSLNTKQFAALSFYINAHTYTHTQFGLMTYPFHFHGLTYKISHQFNQLDEYETKSFGVGIRLCNCCYNISCFCLFVCLLCQPICSHFICVFNSSILAHKSREYGHYLSDFFLEKFPNQKTHLEIRLLYRRKRECKQKMTIK